MTSCAAFSVTQPGHSVQHTYASRTAANPCVKQACKQDVEYQQQPVKQQDVWQQADFDAISVPSYCNLSEEEVQRIQRSFFLGKPVMKHTASPEQALQQLVSRGYTSWKEYLLKVELALTATDARLATAFCPYPS